MSNGKPNCLGFCDIWLELVSTFIHKQAAVNMTWTQCWDVCPASVKLLEQIWPDRHHSPSFTETSHCETFGHFVDLLRVLQSHHGLSGADVGCAHHWICLWKTCTSSSDYERWAWDNWPLPGRRSNSASNHLFSLAFNPFWDATVIYSTNVYKWSSREWIFSMMNVQILKAGCWF